MQPNQGTYHLTGIYDVCSNVILAVTKVLGDARGSGRLRLFPGYWRSGYRYA